MKKTENRRIFIKKILSASSLALISPKSLSKDLPSLPTSHICNSVSELRTLNPSINGEQIYLTGIHKETTNGHGFFYYDHRDSTSLDNGWFIIKTDSGKILKRLNLDKRIELAWSGIENGDSIDKPWQQAINYIIDIVSTTNSTFCIPVIHIPNGEYLLKKTITLPTYITNITVGNTKIKAIFSEKETRAAFFITNISRYDYYKNNSSPHFPTTFRSIAGKLMIILDKDRSISNPAGLLTDAGDNRSGPICMHISDIEFIGGWRAGHECNPINFWGARFSNCVFQGFNALHYLQGNQDSGERISYNNCWFESSHINNPIEKSSAILIESSGMNINFENCSLDYNYGNIITISKLGKWSLIQFNHCHIENFGNYLTNVENNETFDNIHITFRGCNILPNGYNISPSPSRKLFNGGGFCHFDDTFFSWSAYPFDELDGLSTPNSKVKITTNKLKLINTRDIYFTRDAILYEKILSNNITNTSQSNNTIKVKSHHNVDIDYIDSEKEIRITQENHLSGLLIKSTSSKNSITIEDNKNIQVTPGFYYSEKIMVSPESENTKANIKLSIVWVDATGNTIKEENSVWYENIYSYTNAKINGVKPYSQRSNKIIGLVYNAFLAPPMACFCRIKYTINNISTNDSLILIGHSIFYSSRN